MADWYLRASVAQRNRSSINWDNKRDAGKTVDTSSVREGQLWLSLFWIFDRPRFNIKTCPEAERKIFINLKNLRPHIDLFTSQLCLWARQSGQTERPQTPSLDARRRYSVSANILNNLNIRPCLLPRPKTLRRQQRSYNPRRAAASWSLGTATTPQVSVFTGETKPRRTRDGSSVTAQTDSTVICLCSNKLQLVPVKTATPANK